MLMQKVKMINGPFHNTERSAVPFAPGMNIDSKDGTCVHKYERSSESTMTFIKTMSAEAFAATPLCTIPHNQFVRPVKKCGCGYELKETVANEAVDVMKDKCDCPQCGELATHYMYVDKRNLPE